MISFGNNDKTTCAGLEVFEKHLDFGMTRDEIGMVLHGSKMEDFHHKQVFASLVLILLERS